MSEFKGTPGRWAVNEDGWKVESEKDHGWTNDGWIICNTHGPDAEANANLIAAAPELLECLIELRQWISQEIAHPNSPCGRADTAISKALGEEK